jgi:hypothetical protein
MSHNLYCKVFLETFALELAAEREPNDLGDFFVLYVDAVAADGDGVEENLIALKAVDLLLIFYHYLSNLYSNPF